MFHKECGKQSKKGIVICIFALALFLFIKCLVAKNDMEYSSNLE